MRSFSFIEVFAYNLLRAFPLLMLAFYPFYEKKRFSFPVTVLIYNLIIALWLVISIINAYFNGSRTRMGVLEAICIILIAILYASAFKTHPGKMLFFCFMLFNVGYMVTMVSKFLSQHRLS